MGVEHVETRFNLSRAVVPIPGAPSQKISHYPPHVSSAAYDSNVIRNNCCKTPNTFMIFVFIN